MLRPTPEHSDTHLLSRRSALKGLTGMAATVLDSNQSRGADIPDNPFAQNNEYPYLFSPLEAYTQLEKTLIPEHTLAKTVIHIANTIASRVEFIFHREVKRQIDMQDGGTKKSIQLAALQGRFLDLYMYILAGEIRNEGYYYQINSSYHNAMTEKYQRRGWPLDCDLLSHIGLHIAKQHNIPLAGGQSMQHMYLCARSRDKTYDLTLMDTPSYIQHFADIRKNDRLTTRAGEKLGYYQPMNETMMKQIITANVVIALADRRISEGNIDKLEAACRQGEQFLVQVGTSYNMIQCVLYLHRHTSLQYEKKGNDMSDDDKVNAARHISRIAELENNHRDILLTMHQREEAGPTSFR